MSHPALEFDSPFTAEDGPEPSAEGGGPVAIPDQAEQSYGSMQAPPHDAQEETPIFAGPTGVGISPEADEVWEAAEHEVENESPNSDRPADFSGAPPQPSVFLTEEFADEHRADDEERSGDQLRAALASRSWSEAVVAATTTGVRDENRITDLIFFTMHPERHGTRVAAHEQSLARQWRDIRDQIVRPRLKSRPIPAPGGPMVTPVPRQPSVVALGSARSTTWLRRAWMGHAGEKTVRMVPAQLFGLPPTPVHPYTVDAWRALERTLTATGYRPKSVWNYNYRQITAGTGLSLHAYGLATDIDPDCNPFRLTPNQPLIRFSIKPQQGQRCADVKAQLADTAFTPEQVAAVEAIVTVDGLQAIVWGGRWRSLKDAMHFQINVSPRELQRGLRPS